MIADDRIRRVLDGAAMGFAVVLLVERGLAIVILVVAEGDERQTFRDERRTIDRGIDGLECCLKHRP